MADLLIDHGFRPDPSLDGYSHSLRPCPYCPDASNHALFAVWGDEFPTPRFWCQSLKQVVEYELISIRPIVGSIADLKAQRRWIPVSGKRPATNAQGQTATFSHPGPDKSKCGGFEGGITAEQFVREGGVCLNHCRPRNESIPRYASAGWFTYQELAGKGGQPDQISYCPNYVMHPA